MRSPLIPLHAAGLGLAVLALAAGPRSASGQGIVGIADLGPGEVCFTSGNHSTEGADCAAVAVEAIAAAKTSLLVQAYNFTEPRIIAAIIDAHRRNVAVIVIVDKLSA